MNPAGHYLPVVGRVRKQGKRQYRKGKSTSDNHTSLHPLSKTTSFLQTFVFDSHPSGIANHCDLLFDITSKVSYSPIPDPAIAPCWSPLSTLPTFTYYKKYHVTARIPLACSDDNGDLQWPMQSQIRFMQTARPSLEYPHSKPHVLPLTVLLTTHVLRIVSAAEGPLSCCTKCHDPRTSEDFLKHHFKPTSPPATEDTSSQGQPNLSTTLEDDHDCSICRLPYGSENLTVMMRDHPCQVTGLSTCRHTFGIACIKNLMRTHGHGWVRCPLCRTDWCYNMTSQDPGAIQSEPSESLRQYYTERAMLVYGAGYQRAFAFLYGDSAHSGIRKRDPALPFGPFAYERDEIIDYEHKTMLAIYQQFNTETWRRDIEKLAESTDTATLDDPGFDPWDPAALFMVGVANPISFTNWNTDTRTLVQAFYYAMERSQRGMRICQSSVEDFKKSLQYALQNFNEQETFNICDYTGATFFELLLPLHLDAYVKAMEVAMDEWHRVRDEGDIEAFVTMVLTMQRDVLEPGWFSHEDRGI